MNEWEALVVWYLKQVNQYSKEKPVPVPLCPSEILHKLAHNTTQVSKVTGLQLTT
jgi:hypothetical protein